MLPAQSRRPLVVADVEAYYDSVNINKILDGWDLNEVRDLLSGNLEALEEIAHQALEIATAEDVHITFSRGSLAAYVEAREEAIADAA